MIIKSPFYRELRFRKFPDKLGRLIIGAISLDNGWREGEGNMDTFIGRINNSIMNDVKGLLPFEDSEFDLAGITIDIKVLDYTVLDWVGNEFGWCYPRIIIEMGYFGSVSRYEYDLYKDILDNAEYNKAMDFFGGE